jgi:hypothetical protein
MATEEQIKELAYAIWEKDGRPEGKHVDHYFRAKQILEEQQESRVIELAPSPLIAELPPSPPMVQLAPLQPSKRRRSSRHKQR